MSVKIKQLRLINVQSWDDITVDLSEGLNVFSGKSNSGKSVLFKVFRKMTFPNYWGTGANDQIIRDGCDKAIAILGLETGCAIVFEINPTNQMFYYLNAEGKAEGAWKGEMPQELLDILGWYVDRDNKYLLNLIDQQIALPFVDSPESFNEMVLRCVTRHEKLDIARDNLKQYKVMIAGEVSKTTNSIESFYSLMRKMITIDTTPISNLADKHNLLISTLEKIGEICKVHVEDITQPIPVKIPTDFQTVYGVYCKAKLLAETSEEFLQLEAPTKVFINESIKPIVSMCKRLINLIDVTNSLITTEVPIKISINPRIKFILSTSNTANKMVYDMLEMEKILEEKTKNELDLHSVKQRINEIISVLKVCPYCGTTLTMNGDDCCA